MAQVEAVTTETKMWMGSEKWSDSEPGVCVGGDCMCRVRRDLLLDSKGPGHRAHDYGLNSWQDGFT